MKNITENNRLLAEFLGYEFNAAEFIIPEFKVLKEFKTQSKRSTVIESFYTSLFKIEDLKFHSDWNWLMAVVDKIESIILEEVNETSFNVTIGATSYCVIQDNNGGMIKIRGEGETKIQSVYNACTEFVKWFNSQK